MNLILFGDTDRVAPDRIRLDGRRARQVREVHGSTVGDTVRVGEIGGLMGRGTVITLRDDQVELEIELDTPPPEKLPLTLVLALPRPKMLRRILRSCAELGVARLHLINSYRVEKSYWQTPVLAPATIRGYLLDGLQQARDTVLPEVALQRRFKPFVEDELPGIAADSTALVAHPGAATPCPHPLNRSATLALGPEGGFIPYEVEKLQRAGFATVDLGPRILRVETALVAAVSKLFAG